jgi:hypothetical protein
MHNEENAEKVLRPAEEVGDEAFAAGGWGEKERPEETGLEVLSV